MMMYVAAGVLLALLAIPLILGRVPPNRFYGFRVRATLENRKLWYSVNQYAGWRLLIVGMSAIFAAVAFSRIPGIGVDAYAMACLGVVAAGLTLALASSFGYLGSFVPPGEP